MEKQKQQKKNWSLRLIGVAFLLLLMSTCLVAGVLAKYATTGQGGDSGRVAKWGVTINASGSSMFKSSYSFASPQNGVALAASHSTEKLLAPGLSGKTSGFGIVGTPEVACKLTVAVNNVTSELNGWTIPNSTIVSGTDISGDYEPVVWTLKQGGVAIASNVSFSDLLDELNAIEEYFAPGDDLSSAFDYEISWSWPAYVSAANDLKDTYLGNLGTAPTVVLAYTIIIEQVTGTLA